MISVLSWCVDTLVEVCRRKGLRVKLADAARHTPTEYIRRDYMIDSIKRAWLLFKIVRYSKSVLFMDRQIFFSTLQRTFNEGTKIVAAYPDMIMLWDERDYCRAIKAVDIARTERKAASDNEIS